MINQYAPSTLTKLEDHVSSPLVHSIAKKRRGSSLDRSLYPKRSRLSPESAQASPPIEAWLSDLPESGDFECLGQPKIIDAMGQPPSKRSRSQSSGSIDQGVSQLGDETESMMSWNKKYSAYRDVNYEVVLETKGSFMRPSPKGMVDEDEELWDKILTTAQPVPNDLLFDGDYFQSFHSNLRGRSELRICVDLHPRVVPSVENLAITGRKEFDCLSEGYNDPWVKCEPFYGPRPQPDHTIGFKWSSFTEQQRQKLGIKPMENSYYTARENIYFPFFTSEVKCGKQGLDLADRPNTHSMTVAIRGIVEVFRRAGRAADMHRRLAGISISHDENMARIYAHYPEIENERVTYWRRLSRRIDFENERWKCYQVTINVCQMFGLPLLERLKAIVDELPNPRALPLSLTATSEEISVQSSQEDTSGQGSQDANFRKPRQPRGLNAELRNMIQNLQQQGEQQRQDMKAREAMLGAQLEQQRKEAQQQRKEAEQQRKEAEQQQQKAEQQQQNLMKMLMQQSEQISKLLPK